MDKNDYSHPSRYGPEFSQFICGCGMVTPFLIDATGAFICRGCGVSFSTAKPGADEWPEIVYEDILDAEFIGFQSMFEKIEKIYLDGVLQIEGTDYTIDRLTGLVTFRNLERS